MKKIGILSLLLAAGLTISAKENIPVEGAKDQQKTGQTNPAKNKLMKYASDCEPASAQADLDINNVRTRILNGGDMWWDLSNARYEIPKLQDLNAVRKNSLFAGAIWIGGEDEGVLKLAAMTYRQSGSDFWPGPLDKVTSTTNSARCDNYDEIFEVNREDIEKHREAFDNGTLVAINSSIQNWPGNGKQLNDPEQLAPFFDEDGNGLYEPENGDYPVLQTECRGIPIAAEKNGPSEQPDQMLWFVYNDRGNIHSETQGQSIGVELQTTAFAYATNDEINNMTFYTTRIINRGNTQLSNTYFGQWVDPDLGNYSDDFVGCDVGLSLGFCYNGDDNDEGILGYGLNPPSIGVDFFEGPKADTTINGVDTAIELGMSKFVYYDNDFTNFGNPQSPIHYYNYLRGLWKNGDCLTFDQGNGRTGSECTDYIFPGDTDPDHSGVDWNEKSAGNSPADRRFLQTSGPFTLKPGAVNKITVGVVWAKTSSGGATGSLTLLKSSSRKAQELFDNCFDILDGPDAPTVEVRELSNEAIFMFADTKTIESYQEVTVSDGQPIIYHFQGYRVYQLKNSTVGTGDLEDIDKAREIFICDLEDSITRLVNTPFDEALGQPLPKLMVEGPNQGLVHSLSVTEDAFATGSNKQLVNNKTYYFMVISYAALPGHPNQEYLAGRKIQQFSVTPNSPEPREGGLKLKSNYGDGPELVRMEGRGNGGLALELTDASIDEILANGFAKNPTYKIGKGPVDIKIIDPLRVPQGEFELVLLENPPSTSILDRLDGLKGENTNWILINHKPNGTNDTIYSESAINTKYEQLIIEKTTGDALKDWGMAVTVHQVSHPGNPDDASNGLISWEVQWEDNSKQWLSAIPDIDNGGVYNWIRSGRTGSNEATKDYSQHDYFRSGDAVDLFEVYEKIWDGRIGPYRLASRNIYQGEATTIGTPYTGVQGVAFNGTHPEADWHKIDNLSSIDLVITRDKSKWSKCLVLEMGESKELNQGGAEKFEIRKHNSVNKDGSENAGEQGRTWFPGYAINVETGERLNIVLGEDSYQGLNNGRDLKWNPTDRGGLYSSGYMGFGGRHYIYIMDTDTNFKAALYPKGPRYDEGNNYISTLTSSTNYYRDLNNKVLFHAMWAIPTYLANGYSMEEDEQGMPLPPTEVTFKIRVKKPYQYFVTDAGSKNSHNPRYTFNTNSVYTERSAEFGKQALKNVRVVPNPYFAYSEYENNPVENKVKFTNLPQTCKISIYTVDGSLVRKIVKDDQSTELVWDLKNDARVPIASGTYIIHVDAGELGETIVKWMGIIRELDLDSF
ncbi:MAG: hypothetical protein H6608_09380 [Flavobacteriales bacterium]|nr:hypothetical protein [Bacteroidota bacterium]MCB9241332.1 hypothetical protein [Flavobacteriales bacterium]